MSTTDPTVRVLHWNVHSWRDDTGASNVDAVADLIGETRPDVTSLVEVDEPRGSTTLNELADRTGYAWCFIPTFEFGANHPAGGFGNALLTRLPILAVHQWQLLWPPRQFDGSEQSEPRSMLAARLGTQPHPIWVAVTHLPRSDAHARTDALHSLISLIRTWHQPWLVCGDFNTPASSWPDSPPVTIAPDPPQPTHGREAIDYCVASPEVSLHADALSVAGSDHRPILISATPPTPP